MSGERRLKKITILKKTVEDVRNNVFNSAF